MRFARFWNHRRDKSRVSRQRLASQRRLTTALSLEYLEDRRLLTTITPSLSTDGNTFTLQNPTSASASISVPTLRDAVIEANWLFNNASSHTQGVTNTIKLTLPSYKLTLQNTAGYENASLTGDLNINSNLNITGVGLPTVQQQATDRVFAINTSGLTVNFSNLIITGGTAVDDTTPGAQPGTSTATANAEGGGLWAASNTTLALSNVTFRGDEAQGALANASTSYYPNGQAAEGGAIWDSGGTLALTTVTFQGNSASGGGGASGGDGGNAEGGAIYFSGSSLNVTTATFLSNSATGGAGGASGGDGGFAEGGAIYDTAGTLALTTATFTSNSATGGGGGSGGGDGDFAEGGAIYFSGSSLGLTTATFTSNSATSGAGGSGGGDGGESAEGGAIYFSGSSLGLTTATFTSNSATGGTGGASGGDGGTAEGGAIYFSGSSLVLTTATFLSNTATGH